MKNKKCYICKKIKSIDDFYKHNKKSDGLRNECKKCSIKISLKYAEKNKDKINKRIRNHRKSNPWRYILANMKKRCSNKNFSLYYRYGGRGIKCLITEKELKELWFRDKAYLMKRPSIDRIDNDGHYEYGNCRFIEKSENSGKDKRKIVLQYDLNGNFIKEWKSVREASDNLNCSVASISHCCTNKSKTSHGFVWKYKELKNEK